MLNASWLSLSPTPIYLVRSIPVHGRLALISGRCEFKFRNERENILAETKGMSHSFILGFSDCREIAESREKKVAEERSADPVIRVQRNESSFRACSCMCFFSDHSVSWIVCCFGLSRWSSDCSRHHCMQPLELQVKSYLKYWIFFQFRVILGFSGWSRMLPYFVMF